MEPSKKWVTFFIPEFPGYPRNSSRLDTVYCCGEGLPVSCGAAFERSSRPCRSLPNKKIENPLPVSLEKRLRVANFAHRTFFRRVWSRLKNGEILLLQIFRIFRESHDFQWDPRFRSPVFEKIGGPKKNRLQDLAHFLDSPNHRGSTFHRLR